MLTKADKRIVLAYARNDMNANKTSRVLHYQNGSISYHLTKVRDETGLDPRRFYDLIKLVKQFRAAED